MPTTTQYPKHTGNAIFATIGNGQVLDLLRERLTLLSAYDLEQIATEASQQLQMREHDAGEMAWDSERAERAQREMDAAPHFVYRTDLF